MKEQQLNKKIFIVHLILFNMDFKGEMINGKLEVKAIVEKVGNNVIVHVPSFRLIEQLKKDLGGKDKHGIRHIQSI